MVVSLARGRRGRRQDVGQRAVSRMPLTLKQLDEKDYTATVFAGTPAAGHVTSSNHGPMTSHSTTATVNQAAPNPTAV